MPAASTKFVGFEFAGQTKTVEITASSAAKCQSLQAFTLGLKVAVS
jgi:hypothetical protein